MSMPISAPMPGPMPMSVPIQAQGLGAGPSPTPLGKGESIINSLYVKFTSRETGYYITADDLFGIFSKFGVVTSVTIKDLNFDPVCFLLLAFFHIYLAYYCTYLAYFCTYWSI